jgi:hypothetical protein
MKGQSEAGGRFEAFLGTLAGKGIGLSRMDRLQYQKLFHHRPKIEVEHEG